jgi:ABC-2 type transport system ATP-binding protein
VALACGDSDTALRALLSRFTAARDIEVLGAGIEEAFLALTGGEDDLTSEEDGLSNERQELR